MTKPIPKFRKSLNTEQIKLLALLFRFRFATTDLIAQYHGKKNGTATYNRIKILYDQNYIGRHFDKTYSLRGKAAAYYLLSSSFTILKDNPDVNPKALKNLYYDKKAGEQFIDNSLTIFQVYLHLRDVYGDFLDLFTKSELTDMSYLPKPLPSAYIAFKNGANSRTKHFFVLVFEEVTPPYMCLKRIGKVIDHALSGKWHDDVKKYPAILVVCETIKQQITLQRRIANALADYGTTELKFYVTNTRALSTLDSNEHVWQSVSNPAVVNSLREIS